jgi:hypothetical protein
LSALNWLDRSFLSLKLLGRRDAVGGGSVCAKTQRGNHKKRNIRSTLNCFGKGIDFSYNSSSAFKRFFVNLAFDINPKFVLLFKNLLFSYKSSFRSKYTLAGDV